MLIKPTRTREDRGVKAKTWWVQDSLRPRSIEYVNGPRLAYSTLWQQHRGQISHQMVDDGAE
jgi:hypothetical protein